MIFEMRQPATRITPNLGNHNRKIDWTMVWFSSVLWIFLVHRTEPANTKDEEEGTGKGKKKGPPKLYDLTPFREGQEITNEMLHMPSNRNHPILWDVQTIIQALDDEEFEFPKGADHYATEAQEWEDKDKVNGMTCKKGGKGGKHGPFYWGNHNELKYEGAVSFDDAYDSDMNPIDDNGIRRYLVADMFTMPCKKCAAGGKPYFLSGGPSAPLGVQGIDKQELNKACAPCKESCRGCPGHSRLRHRTIIDNPFHQDGAFYKPVPKAMAPKAAAPKAVAPKVATPKVTAPQAEVPAPSNVAGPSKPKGNVPLNSLTNVPSDMSCGRFNSP